MFGAGARVRDFEIWGQLGEGGMSEVWLAKDSTLGVPVVLKTWRGTANAKESEKQADLAGFDRMLWEARLMARIASPRIVRALGAGVEDGVGYVAEEYVDGIDLAELDARRRGSLGVGLPL